MTDNVRGFRVEIDGAGGKEVDTAWEMWTGGGDEVSHCDDPGHTAHPTRTCGQITLRGHMTAGRKALMTWINETVQGKPWKRTLTITELLSVDGGVKDGKQYIYSDCFPVGYVFPRMSVTNTTGNTMEEVRIKPIRCELK